MSRPRLKQDIDGKWEDLYNVYNTIVKQGIGRMFGYCARVTIGVSSSMSKTRLKQDTEVKLEDLSNVSNTIVKQGIEAEVWDIAPMFQYELARLCLRLVRSKTLRENRMIAQIYLRPL